MGMSIVGSRPLAVLVLVAGLLQLVPAWALEVEGELRWMRRVELGTPLTGVVVEVKVAPGEQVDKGDLLLRLDGRLFKAELQRREAAFEKATLELAEAERELERANELYDRTLLSNHDLELAKVIYAGVKAAWADARSGRTEAAVRLGYTSLHAPFDALVLEQLTEVGESVNAQLTAQPLMVLADRRRMLARISLSESQLSSLHSGQEATVLVADKRYAGHIRSLGYEPLSGADGVRYPVDIEFALNDGQPLRAGQRVRVELQSADNL